MKRGELYRVYRPSAQDPRRHRVFVVVSRQALLDSRFSTAICAPIYSSHDGLATQVVVGVEVGLKHASSIHCDELVSLHKAALTDYVGALTGGQLARLGEALAIAMDIEHLAMGSSPGSAD